MTSQLGQIRFSIASFEDISILGRNLDLRACPLSNLSSRPYSTKLPPTVGEDSRTSELLLIASGDQMEPSGRSRWGNLIGQEQSRPRGKIIKPTDLAVLVKKSVTRRDS